MMTLTEQIKNDIETNPIILYMKGTKQMPMCGFSSTVVNILNMHDVEYKDVNILRYGFVFLNTQIGPRSPNYL